MNIALLNSHSVKPGKRFGGGIVMRWEKLIIIVVISIFVVVCVLGGLYIGFMYAPKKIKAEETTTPIETVENTKETINLDVVVPVGTVPEPYETEGGLPPSGTTWSFDVFPEEIEVLTGGQGMINGIMLPGGDNPDRGFLLIMLPDPYKNKTIRYEVTELWPGSNWHGSYKYGRIPTEADWHALMNNRSFAMFDPNEGNGAHGKGVWILDQVVVQGSEVIFYQTVNRQ